MRCMDGADEDATEVPVQAREIGFVFQSYALFRHMTVAQNIAFGPRIRRLGIDIDQRRAVLLHPLLLVQWPVHRQLNVPGFLTAWTRQRCAPGCVNGVRCSAG